MRDLTADDFTTVTAGDLALLDLVRSVPADDLDYSLLTEDDW